MLNTSFFVKPKNDGNNLKLLIIKTTRSWENICSSTHCVIKQTQVKYQIWVLWSYYTHWDKSQLFAQKFTKILEFGKCEFWEKLHSLLWILWKLRFFLNCDFSEKKIISKCEFCKKWDFANVNSVKIDIFKLWSLWFFF